MNVMNQVWRLPCPHELIPLLLIPQKEVKHRLPLPGQKRNVIRMASRVTFTRQPHEESQDRGPLQNAGSPVLVHDPRS